MTESDYRISMTSAELQAEWDWDKACELVKRLSDELAKVRRDNEDLKRIIGNDSKELRSLCESRDLMYDAGKSQQDRADAAEKRERKLLMAVEKAREILQSECVGDSAFIILTEAISYVEKQS